MSLLSGTRSLCRLRPTLIAAVTLVAVTGCSVQVNGPDEGDVRDAGREYGETLAGTLGSRTSEEELRSLCGEGAMEEGYVTKGREGDETDVEADAFITACTRAVSGK